MQEGAGHQLLSAFVEIVFDNTDNRIPVSLWFVYNFKKFLESTSDAHYFLSAFEKRLVNNTSNIEDIVSIFILF